MLHPVDSLNSRWRNINVSVALRSNKRHFARFFVIKFEVMLASPTFNKKATSSMTEKKKQRSNDARTHPCIVPFVTSESLDASLPSITWPCMPSWSDRITWMNFSGQPISLSTCQNPCLFTVLPLLGQ